MGSMIYTSLPRKKKQKYKSAEHKKKELEAQKFQQELYKKWDISNCKTKGFKDYNPEYSHRSSNDNYVSVIAKSARGSRKESPKYSGDLVTGIAIMHKSCLQPIINKEQAIESARMRR